MELSALHDERSTLLARERTVKCSLLKIGSIIDGRNDDVDAKSRVVNSVFFP